ncbi:Ada metal-binding domain-containing protein [Flavobacterium sp. J27]|uniref:Ada metal-binding domain-containing protein n=1 Tax=Flavobacterium sp. J27 TaxID=2060419 RepID=UPI001030BC30|nr:Ada metal-binding domain-containing protein [Flavobacterium sp. J27]
MIHHSEIANNDLYRKIKQREINFGGNKKLKIYGFLNCKSGKRMNRENRVFFSSIKEAIENGFRPCGHCMKSDYNIWKNDLL